MVNSLIFGGISSLDYGAVVDASGAFVGAERDVTTISVPGRNGDLVLDNGRYKNVEVPYTLYFPDSAKLEAYRHAVLSLTGYQRLEDSHLPDEFRMARLAGEIDASAFGYRARSGELKLTFDCKPQRFLKSGEIAIPLPEGETRLVNPTGMLALPLIYATSICRFTLGDMTIYFRHGRPAYIDSETQNVYYEGANEMPYYSPIPAGFATLPAGETVINVEAALGTVEIYPRWWKL